MWFLSHFKTCLDMVFFNSTVCISHFWTLSWTSVHAGLWIYMCAHGTIKARWQQRNSISVYFPIVWSTWPGVCALYRVFRLFRLWEVSAALTPAPTQHVPSCALDYELLGLAGNWLMNSLDLQGEIKRTLLCDTTPTWKRSQYIGWGRKSNQEHSNETKELTKERWLASYCCFWICIFV